VADLLEIVGERLLRGALATPEAGNVDQQRYPQGMPLPGADESAAMLARIHHRAAELQRLYAMLDSRSAQLLIDRLVFLVLGPQRAQLGPPIETIHELLAFARGVLITEFDVCDLDYGDGTHTHRFDLRPLGYPLDVESYMFGVQGTFQLQQYRCPDTPQAWPRPGDVAIDAGGFFGETALWLACLTGPQGRVLSLEFAAHNLPFMRANLEANPEFAAQVSVLERALWDESGIELPISLGGPATTVTGGEGYALVPSMTASTSSRWTSRGPSPTPCWGRGRPCGSSARGWRSPPITTSIMSGSWRRASTHSASGTTSRSGTSPCTTRRPCCSPGCPAPDRLAAASGGRCPAYSPSGCRVRLKLAR
jgi:hypothetical protein